MYSYIISAMLVCFSLGSCSHSVTEVTLPAEALRVLFVGNSLTYDNDLPSALADLALRDSMPMFTASIAKGNYALEDHWNEGEVQRALESGDWDVVVMQQGPSSLPANQAHLKRWAETFAPVIRDAGATPALYMVWPDASRRFAFPDVDAAYANAARAVDGLLLPVGRAWTEAWRQDSELAFYSADQFHPSRLGTAFAAFVIYYGLTERMPNVRQFEVGGRTVRFTDTQVRIFREATEAVYQRPVTE
ncbi:MAG: hypothetical protein RhofKO_06020 [Rhodothermales bacterium]